MTDRFTGDTPDLSTLMTQAARLVQSSSFTALIGTIKSYSNGRASVTPATRATGGDGSPRTLPDLPSMPVWMPASADAEIRYTPQVGDPCVVIFMSVASAGWITSGETGAVPEDQRRQSLSDGVVLAGLRSFADPPPTLPGVNLSIGARDGSAPYLHMLDAGGWLLEVAGAQRVTVGAGAAFPVALANLVTQELAAIKLALDAIAAAVPTVNPYPGPGVIGATKLSSE